MYKGQTVFSQIMDFVPIKKFRRCVDRYNGNYRVRSFTCMDQFFCMAFAQLTYRESLRDIECCLRAMHEKLYHMGIRGNVSRSTIAYGNENRDWRIYCDFAQILIHQARKLYAGEDFGLQLDETFTPWMLRSLTYVCRFFHGLVFVRAKAPLSCIRC